MLKNAFEALDRNPTAIVSRHFITRDYVASSERSITVIRYRYLTIPVPKDRYPVPETVIQFWMTVSD